MHLYARCPCPELRLEKTPSDFAMMVAAAKFLYDRHDHPIVVGIETVSDNGVEDIDAQRDDFLVKMVRQNAYDGLEIARRPDLNKFLGLPNKKGQGRNKGLP